MSMKYVLILHAPGTNRDGDLADAIRLAGGEPEILPISSLGASFEWRKYHMLAIPGGFSYGDALGAGKLWAFDIQSWMAAWFNAFVDSGRPVIGICNGFQVLVKAGILPGEGQRATLTNNASGHFECRWVNLAANRQNSSPWLQGIDRILCPVAHGEGRFLMADGMVLPDPQIAFRYAGGDGSPVAEDYPQNPNGSPDGIAGITNTQGNVLGLMPHPENHIHAYQHPLFQRGGGGLNGLKLFQNGLAF